MERIRKTERKMTQKLKEENRVIEKPRENIHKD